MIDIYREFHQKAPNYTFFSSAHGTLSNTDHIWDHKASLGKYKKIKTHIFSDHNTKRLEINYNKTTLRNINNMVAKQYVTIQPLNK